MTTRKFHISDVLSVVTPYFVCNRGMEGIYDILGHLTGESLMTHQLPRACKPCKEFLLTQLPQFTQTDLPANAGEEGWNWELWVQRMTEKHGEWFDIPPMPEGEFYTSMHPLEEPILKGKTVIVIDESSYSNDN